MKILGFHHISLISSNMLRTIEFYTQVLGLRLLKQTVDFENPGTYHLYFGDAAGRPGTLLTFFIWPGASPGQTGVGGLDHLAWEVNTTTGLLQWKRWLVDHGVPVRGPFGRGQYHAVSFTGPDGEELELLAAGPLSPGSSERRFLPVRELLSADQSESWPEPVSEITAEMSLAAGLHHLALNVADLKASAGFYGSLLGLVRAPLPGPIPIPRTGALGPFEGPITGQEAWAVGRLPERPAYLAALERQPSGGAYARTGAGRGHHFALAVPDEGDLTRWRERLLAAGLQARPVRDRLYFKSLYFRDPDGEIVELATLGPGFTVDEAPDHLGQSLKLPPWLEPRRGEIEGLLEKGHQPMT